MDAALLEFCATPRQREVVQAVIDHGGNRAAARALGLHSSSVDDAVNRAKKAAALQGWAPEYDMTRPAPPGFNVKGTSTLYNSKGEQVAQWVKTAADREEREALLQEAVRALCEDIEPLPLIKKPASNNESLMSVYPVGDHHIGMLSWHEETGADYNINESERLLIGAMDYLVDAAPPSHTAAVVLLGDYLHFDSFDSVTPASKHQLDADSRYPKMVRAAMKTIRHAIFKALQKHERVKVVVSSGNHDPSSMAFLREALSCLYERNPRVEIDRTPSPFHFVRFHSVLIGVHHGDKVKMKDLPLVMAHDRAKDWGETKHRYVYTGHIHHDSAIEHGGVKVESFRILPPLDAYAHGGGWRSGRDMKRIDYHAEHGEVARQLVTPAMLS